jgi:hypothetical protein
MPYDEVEGVGKWREGERECVKGSVVSIVFNSNLGRTKEELD